MTMTDVEQTVIPEGTGLLAVLDSTGDTRIMWDPARPDEVEMAQDAFKKAKKKGYVAHKVGTDGEPGEVIRDFDPRAGKIIMTPQLVGG